LQRAPTKNTEYRILVFLRKAVAPIMAMAKSFKDLLAWQKAHALVLDVYKETSEKVTATQRVILSEAKNLVV